jgi:hypothetical protein
MIGRADIEGSKSDVALDAWPPQASYPYGNFSDTSNFKFGKNAIRLFTFTQLTKGSLGHAFTANICTENISQISYWPAPLLQVSNLNVLIFVHLRYLLKSVPPQPNSPLEDFPSR